MNTDQSANDLMVSCRQAQQSERGLPGLEGKRDSGPLFAAHQVSNASFQFTSLYIQWNLSIVGTTGTQLVVLYTLEPLYRGHYWDPAGCPVYSGTSL